VAYLNPNLPQFRNWPTASGPGVHTDEASSALPDIGEFLSGSTLAKLEAHSEGPRANPSEGEEEDDEIRIIQVGELLPIAMSVTGMWGFDPAHAPKSAEGGRRYLPTMGTRANPSKQPARMSEPYFVRMRLLKKQLLALQVEILARYAKTAAPRLKAAIEKQAKRGKTLPVSFRPKEPWAEEIPKMIAAVEWVLGQEHKTKKSILDQHGMPFGFKAKPKSGKRLAIGEYSIWGILAKSNAKLNFTALSELPQSTCPGSGACRVDLDAFDESKPKNERGYKGWCYSFKPLFRATVFSRLFLNTMANYADREFAIIAGGGAHLGANEHDIEVYKGRVGAALAGEKSRLWPQYVKCVALNMTRKLRANGQTIFMRLYVDGDIGHEDSIVRWMEVCGQVGPGGRDITGTLGPIQFYAYSKAWPQFLNVNEYLGGKWPSNYTLNMSSGSEYSKQSYGDLAQRMLDLPITRGYFEAIPLEKYIVELRAQSEVIKTNPNSVVQMHEEGLLKPALGSAPFKFDPKRVQAFLALNNVKTYQDAQEILGFGFQPPLDSDGRPKKLDAEQIRLLAYEYYLNSLIRSPDLGAIIRREKLRDVKGHTIEAAALAKYEEEQKEILRAALQGGKASSEWSQTELHKKALALTLHEVLWSFKLGGSCPLICGSCSDHPTDPALGVHRCASRGVFWKETIRIGLHVFPLVIALTTAALSATSLIG
jgi:hypothetical protein